MSEILKKQHAPVEPEINDCVLCPEYLRYAIYNEIDRLELSESQDHQINPWELNQTLHDLLDDSVSATDSTSSNVWIFNAIHSDFFPTCQYGMMSVNEDLLCEYTIAIRAVRFVADGPPPKITEQIERDRIYLVQTCEVIIREVDDEKPE